MVSGPSDRKQVKLTTVFPWQVFSNLRYNAGQMLKVGALVRDFLTTKDTAWLAVLEAQLPPQGSGRFTLALAGPSGVGKSTLARALQQRFSAGGRRSGVLAMDDFFEAPEKRRQLSEWGPEHVRFDELHQVLSAYDRGEKMPTVMRYLRSPHGRLEAWQPELDEVEVLIFEGLYALSKAPECGALYQHANMGIFLEAPLAQIKAWRFAQEAAKPAGRSTHAMERHWHDGILPDTRDRVLPSRANAAMVLAKDAAHQWRMSDPKADSIVLA